MEILDDRPVIYQLEVYKKWYEEQQEEIERLNKVIDELEEYLNKIIDTSAKCEKITCQYVLQYLQKLKGSDKDETN